VPYDARVLQILIASPGDVQSEREIISQVIYEWNYTNSRERGVVLLPIRWETHASPEMGSRPQAVINRQVVDQCDMAVAVFWMRLGTPTGEPESGTAEEIARMGNAGKTVMLYFSDAQVRPRSINIAEYQRLLEFQEQTYPKGLIEAYYSLDEFRDKFRRQLAIRISNIIAADSQGVRLFDRYQYFLISG
jgi:nucleoside 2-deoxyribosyltransferase